MIFDGWTQAELPHVAGLVGGGVSVGAPQREDFSTHPAPRTPKTELSPHAGFYCNVLVLYVVFQPRRKP